MLTRLCVLLAVAGATLAWAGSALAVSPNVVISQVYGGGGNTGAPYTNDYVELFNRGTSTVSLTGWSIQYASATGTGNFGANDGQLTGLSGFIAPGQYFLVQEAGGAVGASLPPADVVDAGSPISMSASAGKVALVNTTSSLGCNGGSTPCSIAALSSIVDLVGYGNANFFEGSAAAPTLTNTTAALRQNGGCTDTDSNAADFSAGAPTPRNSVTTHACVGDAAPAVVATSPVAGASGVALDADVSITFSEPVDVADGWYTISCATSGSHAATVSGGPTTFTLDPDSDFAQGETCTVTVAAAQVSDVDADDPPDTLPANHQFSFTTFAPPPTIAEIQGAGHLSPKNGAVVSGVEGVVTALRPATSRGFWMQDPVGDGNDATSEGIFVFTNSTLTVHVGDRVRVSGRVSEFRAANDPDNLTITEIVSPTVGVLSTGNPVPAATVLGTGGRMPPTENIEDDANGSVETMGVFDPASDAIDFYESLEGMLLQVDGAAVVGATRSFGEITLLPNGGTWATGMRTPRGGILLGGYADANPERITVDDEILRDLAGTPRPAKAMPDMNVGDSLLAPVVGPLDYSFSNYKIQATSTPVSVSGGIVREVTATPTDRQVAVATFNVENLAGTDPQSKYDQLASLIVDHVKSPDILGIEEVQDNDGVAGGTGSPVVDASVSWNRLVQAIQAAGGPLYEYRQIDPVDDEDGGAPGGNIRVGFLFRTDRGVEFIDRPGGTSTTNTSVVSRPSGPQLTFSPGRLGTSSASFDETRKPLAGEFRARGKKLFVVLNHFSSKGDDQPLFGPAQPPTRFSEVARHGQAQVVNDFVDSLLAIDPSANIVVLGDINDFEFSETVDILEGGGVLHSLVKDLPADERYSYVFEGNSQVLDQILVSANVEDNFGHEYDVVHVNSEFADAIQASDHEPSVVRLDLRGRPTGA